MRFHFLSAALETLSVSVSGTLIKIPESLS
jgi:hypothetical protein